MLMFIEIEAMDFSNAKLHVSSEFKMFLQAATLSKGTEHF
jgi:hypothetical protein